MLKYWDHDEVPRSTGTNVELLVLGLLAVYITHEVVAIRH